MVSTSHGQPGAAHDQGSYEDEIGMDEDDTATQEGDQDAPEGQHVTLKALRAQLGIAEALPSTTATLPVESLYIEGEDQLRGARAFQTSYALIGMLNPPTVIAETDPADGARVRYRVVAGRRRVHAARQSKVTEIECHVYDGLTPAQEAVVVLTENGRRGPAPLAELAAMRTLVDRGVGLSIRAIVKATGSSHGSVAERVRLAHLPGPLLDQALAGTLPYATLKRIARLTFAQQRELAARASTGEAITDEIVRRALTAQFNEMAAPLHLPPAAAAATPTQDGPPASEAPASDEAPAAKKRGRPTAAQRAATTYRADLADMIATLDAWQTKAATWTREDARHQKLALLTRALAQEVAILTRQAAQP